MEINIELIKQLMEYDMDQFREINKGVLMGLPAEKIAYFSNSNLSYLEMRIIRDAIIDGLDEEKIKIMADPSLNYPKRIILEEAFKNGELSVEEVMPCISEDYKEMHTRLLEAIVNHFKNGN